MATPPFSITETVPGDTDFMSVYPVAERTFRDVVESWLTFISDPTTGLLKSTAMPSPLVSLSDDTATGGPNVIFERISATPTAADFLASLIFRGKDSVGNSTDYVTFKVQIADATNLSEDGTLIIQQMVGGVPTTTTFTLTGTGLTLAGTLNAAAITSSAAITAVQTFQSSTGNVVLATTGAGSCFLRPNGAASGSGQMVVASTGNATINGTLTVTG